MKQHITVEQLNEAEDLNIAKKWLRWLIKKGYITKNQVILLYGNTEPNRTTVLEKCGIGQMIEFLSESIVDIEKKDEVTRKWLRVSCGERLIDDYDELCDALWSAVKTILEK